MGSSSDGEDVVQDTIERALAVREDLPAAASLRPWLFRIARNRALDLIRSRAVRLAEPLEAASGLRDPAAPDPLEVLMRRQALQSYLARLIRLSARQRDVVILKDVLGDTLLEIAGRLDLTVDAVKARLARARARLVELDTEAADEAEHAAAELARFLAPFDAHNWEALRNTLARKAERALPAIAGAGEA